MMRNKDGLDKDYIYGVLHNYGGVKEKILKLQESDIYISIKDLEWLEVFLEKYFNDPQFEDQRKHYNKIFKKNFYEFVKNDINKNIHRKKRYAISKEDVQKEIFSEINTIAAAQDCFRLFQQFMLGQSENIRQNIAEWYVEQQIEILNPRFPLIKPDQEFCNKIHANLKQSILQSEDAKVINLLKIEISEKIFEYLYKKEETPNNKETLNILEEIEKFLVIRKATVIENLRLKKLPSNEKILNDILLKIDLFAENTLKEYLQPKYHKSVGFGIAGYALVSSTAVLTGGISLAIFLTASSLVCATGLYYYNRPDRYKILTKEDREKAEKIFDDFKEILKFRISSPKRNSNSSKINFDISSGSFYSLQQLLDLWKNGQRISSYNSMRGKFPSNNQKDENESNIERVSSPVLPKSTWLKGIVTSEMTEDILFTKLPGAADTYVWIAEKALKDQLMMAKVPTDRIEFLINKLKEIFSSSIMANKFAPLKNLKANHPVIIGSDPIGEKTFCHEIKPADWQYFFSGFYLEPDNPDGLKLFVVCLFGKPLHEVKIKQNYENSIRAIEIPLEGKMKENQLNLKKKEIKNEEEESNALNFSSRRN